MSRSSLRMQFKFSMLDKHHETCNKEWIDWSCGHTQFDGGTFKLRTGMPSASYFEHPDYDRQKCKELIAKELREEFSHFLDRYIDSQLERMLTQAEEHCRTVHGKHVNHPSGSFPR